MIRDELLASLADSAGALPGVKVVATRVDVRLPQNKHVIDAIMTISISGHDVIPIREIRGTLFGCSSIISLSHPRRANGSRFWSPGRCRREHARSCKMQRSAITIWVGRSSCRPRGHTS